MWSSGEVIVQEEYFAGHVVTARPVTVVDDQPDLALLSTTSTSCWLQLAAVASHPPRRRVSGMPPIASRFCHRALLPRMDSKDGCAPA